MREEGTRRWKLEKVKKVRRWKKRNKKRKGEEKGRREGRMNYKKICKFK